MTWIKLSILRYWLMLIVVLFLGITLSLFYQQRSQAFNIPDTPEAREIMATVERAYDILAVPFDALEVSKLSEVFIDDPIFLESLTSEQRKEAQARISTILGAKTAENFGYLTAMKARRLHQQHGATLLKAAVSKAKTSDGTLAEEEMADLTKQNYGKTPYLPDSSLPGRFPLTYISIKIDNDNAYVRYDDGPALQEAILVRVNGIWFIAGIIPIQIHF